MPELSRHCRPVGLHHSEIMTATDCNILIKKIFNVALGSKMSIDVKEILEIEIHHL